MEESFHERIGVVAPVIGVIRATVLMESFLGWWWECAITHGSTNSQGRNRILLAAAFLAGYVAVFAIVNSMALQSYDQSGFETLNQLASSQAFSYIVIAVNEFGSELILIPFAGLMYLVSKSRKLETASLIVYSIVVSDVILTILKAAYFRPRPSQALPNVILPLGPETDSSFPSGHATRAFVVATLTTMMRGRKYLPLLVLAAGVAIARVVLGVHYPLDVTGGAFLGLLIGIVSFETGRRLYCYAMPKLFPDRTFH